MEKKVHFCSQVEVYQPVFIGDKQVYLLHKQVLRDDDSYSRPIKCRPSCIKYPLRLCHSSLRYGLSQGSQRK